MLGLEIQGSERAEGQHLRNKLASLICSQQASQVREGQRQSVQHTGVQVCPWVHFISHVYETCDMYCLSYHALHFSSFSGHLGSATSWKTESQQCLHSPLRGSRCNNVCSLRTNSVYVQIPFYSIETKVPRVIPCSLSLCLINYKFEADFK